MKLVSKFLLVCVIIVLGSSCIKETKYDFNPIGDAYLEVSRSADSSLQFRLRAHAVDFDFGQAIQPATMEDPYGTIYDLSNIPYGFSSYQSEEWYPFYQSDISRYQGLYNFIITRFSDGLVANSTDDLETIPSPSISIISIDSITQDNRSNSSGTLHLVWGNVPEADFYNLEIYDIANNNALIYLGSVTQDSSATFTYNLNNGGGFINGNQYQVKLLSVTYETGSSYNYAYETSDESIIIWE